MENFIVAVILTLIIVGIILYLVRQKNNGVKCVGCPHGKQCGGNCSGNCNRTENHQE